MLVKRGRSCFVRVFLGGADISAGGLTAQMVLPAGGAKWNRRLTLRMEGSPQPGSPQTGACLQPVDSAKNDTGCLTAALGTTQAP